MEEVLPNIYLIDTLSYVEKGTIAAYVLRYEKTAVIDPGTAKGANIIIEELRRVGINRIDYVAPTHIHIDHGGGAATLAKRMNARVIVHPRGAKHVVNPEKLWMASKQVLGELAETYGKPEPLEEERLIVVEDGQKFDLGGDVLVAYHAPGHAPHMLVYYLQNAKVLFPADAVGMYFGGMVFPLTPPPFDVDAALETLERLMKLDVEYVAFTHYGVAEGKWTIQKSYEKIKVWFDAAAEVAAGSGSVDKLVDRLAEVDEDVRRLKEEFKDKPIALGFVYTAAFGLLDAAKRKV